MLMMLLHSAKPSKKHKPSLQYSTSAKDLVLIFRSTKLKHKSSIWPNPCIWTVLYLNWEDIEDVSDFTYLGQVITNSNEKCFTEHRASRAKAKFNELRAVLADKKVNLKTRRKILESCVRSRLLYGVEADIPNEAQLKKLESCWFECLRSMVKRGWERRNTSEDVDPEDADFSFIYTNQEIQDILRTKPLRNVIHAHHLRYIGHVCRSENICLTKKVLFANQEESTSESHDWSTPICWEYLYTKWRH